ncbi:hypothetical protein [Saccharophagus degradans]|uniref:Uncharacterized protein n=1 Tax=Saccharophagus degradans TaxID=86304 RepID=A0AAW7WZ11_9GAMM|nr:hypothetical protein [Saccharophagus degradans]MDO6420846.1 hypothetical protein [Saccharophagus degradans]MDO6609799.1 hypothetical protein [Saccharophagus degradans]
MRKKNPKYYREKADKALVRFNSIIVISSLLALVAAETFPKEKWVIITWWFLLFWSSVVVVTLVVSLIEKKSIYINAALLSVIGSLSLYSVIVRDDVWVLMFSYLIALFFVGSAGIQVLLNRKKT